MYYQFINGKCISCSTGAVEKSENEVSIYSPLNNQDIENIHIKNGEVVYEVYITPETIEIERQNKIEALKKIRDAKELEPIEYNGSSFDFDVRSFDRINAAITTLEIANSDVIEWTLADNTKKEVTALDLKNVIAQAGIRSNLLHIQYRSLKEMVLIAETIDEINLINWAE